MNIYIDVNDTTLRAIDDMVATRRKELGQDSPKARKPTIEEYAEARRLYDTEGKGAANAYLRGIQRPKYQGERITRTSVLNELLSEAIAARRSA